MLCRNVSGVLSSRCGDDTHRRILQPCFYGRAHGGTERIIHAVRYAFLDFVFVAHPHLEIIDDERREGGYFLALAWQRATRPVDAAISVGITHHSCGMAAPGYPARSIRR